MPVSRHDEQLEPFAAALAYALPGLGHLALGRPKRAACIFIGVMGLFFGGIFIGGIDAVDRKEDFWWFVGQAGVGPVAFAVDRVHQNWFKVQDEAAAGGPRTMLPDENPKNRKSLGHPNEIGALYATIAGMLNVICVLDCLWHAPRPRPEAHVPKRRASDPEPAS
jgi:hypothetical protein